MGRSPRCCGPETKGSQSLSIGQKGQSLIQFSKEEWGILACACGSVCACVHTCVFICAGPSYLHRTEPPVAAAPNRKTETAPP